MGIVSEADLLPIEARPDPRSQATPLSPTAGSLPQTVAEVMTRRVLSVTTHCHVSQVARILLEADYRRVPVVEVVGIVSRRDLVKVIARRDETVKSEISDRRLAESVALTVPGVLEVRLTDPRGH